jgi:hypothetical protein
MYAAAKLVTVPFCLSETNSIFPLYLFAIMSRDSVVGIATAYWLYDAGVGVRVPVGSIIFSSQYRRNRLWGPPCLLSNEYRGEAAGA